MKLEINSNDEVIMNGEQIELGKIYFIIKKNLTKHKKMIIEYSYSDKANLKTRLEIKDRINFVLDDLKNELARKKYKKDYSQLQLAEQEDIRSFYSLKFTKPIFDE